MIENVSSGALVPNVVWRPTTQKKNVGSYDKEESNALSRTTK